MRLQDVLNIPPITRLLSQLESGQCAVRIVRNQEPSPFARSLFSQFMAAYLYSQDDPLMPADVQPAVDQHILDEILHRRARKKASRPGSALPGPMRGVATAAFWVWIIPRTSELLEKIEAAGAAESPTPSTIRVWATWAASAVWKMPSKCSRNSPSGAACSG